MDEWRWLEELFLNSDIGAHVAWCFYVDVSRRFAWHSPWTRPRRFSFSPKLGISSYLSLAASMCSAWWFASQPFPTRWPTWTPAPISSCTLWLLVLFKQWSFVLVNHTLVHVPSRLVWSIQSSITHFRWGPLRLITASQLRTHHGGHSFLLCDSNQMTTWLSLRCGRRVSHTTMAPVLRTRAWAGVLATSRPWRVTASCDELDFVFLLGTLADRHKWACIALLCWDHTIKVCPKSLRLLPFQVTRAISTLWII